MKKYIVSAIIVIEAALIAFLLFSSYQRKKETIALRLEIKNQGEVIEEKDGSLENLQARFDTLEGIRSELEERVDGVMKENAILTAKLEGVSKAREDFFSYLNNQQDSLLGQIRSLSLENQDMLTTFLGKIEEAVEQGIVKANTLAVPEDSKLGEGSVANVNLKKIVVEKNAAFFDEVSSARGKILKIDYLYNLAVISLGERDGVSSGMNLSVLRKRRKIGELVVKETYQNMSIAENASEKSQTRLKRGDTVIIPK